MSTRVNVNIAYIATQTSRGWVSTSGWADAIAQLLKNSQERASTIQEFWQPRPSNPDSDVDVAHRHRQAGRGEVRRRMYNSPGSRGLSYF